MPKPYQTYGLGGEVYNHYLAGVDYCSDVEDFSPPDFEIPLVGVRKWRYNTYDCPVEQILRFKKELNKVKKMGKWVFYDIPNELIMYLNNPMEQPTIEELARNVIKMPVEQAFIIRQAKNLPMPVPPVDTIIFDEPQQLELPLEE